MQIRDIFSKNLFRPINGVVKADQKDKAVVWQELDEYVITKELDQHFRKFFAAFLYAIQNAHDPNIIGRIGIWVSGFFASGKSHFIKILSYLLSNLVAQNPDTGEEKEAVRFFEHKIQDPMLLADIKKATSTNTDVILFNIDSRADSREGRGAILSVFWRVFNEMQGFSGDAPHIAEMERQLSKKGKFQEFCTAFKEVSGEDWLSQRDAYLFHKDDLVYALSQALGQSQESAAEWFEKAEQSMSLTIENFAKRVNEYLDARGKDHRLIFLVDEVGQFIGDDEHLMLNLQTITEDLGRICKGRAWVVVTSQEDIDSILGDLKSSRANDFSKIQGRFTTRLSLSSPWGEAHMPNGLFTSRRRIDVIKWESDFYEFLGGFDHGYGSRFLGSRLQKRERFVHFFQHLQYAFCLWGCLWCPRGATIATKRVSLSKVLL